MMGEKDAIPYWNVNVPEAHWTDKPSEALANVDQFDREILSIKDEDYHIMNWEEVKKVIRENRLELFKRKPSDLRRYREYIAAMKKQSGSVMNYILKERLHWSDLTPKGDPFEYPSDVKILLNDWPYGIDPKIVHIVVWTKFGFEEDSNTGDLTSNARKQIDNYVTDTFRQSENPNHVAWFKNWAALKSIQAVEHFHVMMYDPDPEVIKRVTGNDEALFQKLAVGNEQ